MQPPGSAGFVCVSGNIGRFDRPADIIRGPFDGIEIDVSAVPVNPPATILPGDTWHFQCWYRDVGGTNNFTDAVSVMF
ncbi:MAG: hypothetical protein GY711_10750 [bacterium]|nr:hypothetical protein [bacterium]